MLVLLDTNAYLRLAKRVRPVVGIKFGQKDYVLTIHKTVEDEVRRNPRLKSRYPRFDTEEFADRCAHSRDLRCHGGQWRYDEVMARCKAHRFRQDLWVEGRVSVSQAPSARPHPQTAINFRFPAPGKVRRRLPT